MILFALLIVVVLFVGVLAAFVGVFMLSCRWAGLPRPRVMTALGVVIATLVIWAIIEAVFLAGLKRLYEFAGFPPWEVWIVGIFAGLPVSLAAGTLLHVLLMQVPTSKAVQVWFIERLIRFSFVLFGAGVFVTYMLAKK